MNRQRHRPGEQPMNTVKGIPILAVLAEKGELKQGSEHVNMVLACCKTNAGVLTQCLNLA